MYLSDLTEHEQAALLRMLQYWLSRWDWECPTLFGMEKDELQAIVAAWPASLSQKPEVAALALAGALRELLFGASIPKPEALPALVGLSHNEAIALQVRIWPRIEALLG